MEAAPVQKESGGRGPKRESLGANLVLNIILPSLFMLKGQAWLGWSPKVSLLVALVFPVGYGLYDFVVAKRTNMFSIVGFVSLLLTGGIGLMALPKEWIAVKEAAVPFVLGAFVLGSLKTPYPLVKKLLCNPDVMDMPLVYQRLDERGTSLEFETLLTRCTYLLSSSFLLSAILNFILAKVVVKSESGTQAFTEELGRMNLWTYPVIVLPCTVVMLIALFVLVSGIKKLTGLELEQVIKSPEKK